MAIVHLEHDYAVPSKTLWDLVIDFDCLAKVCVKTVTFEGLPSGKCETGQHIDVMVSLFGKLPKQPYSMDVLECNHDTMTLRSSEKGAGVKHWNHTLNVVDMKQGSRLIDHIDIDAGFMTPLFKLWANYLYKSRHQPRLKLLGLAQ